MAERRESREALEAQAESPSSPGLWQVTEAGFTGTGTVFP